jgi:hypothetical protein
MMCEHKESLGTGTIIINKSFTREGFERKKGMDGLMRMPEEFQLPEKYEFETVLGLTEQAIQFARQVTGEVAVYAGINLAIIKEHEGHGNWYRALDRLDLSPQKAERLMKLGRAFGENPAIVFGLSQRKALQAASFIEDNLLQLRKDQMFIDQDGNAYTLSEIQDSVERQMTNLRNEKNKEVREWKDFAGNLEKEMDSMRQEYHRQTALNEQLMRDASATMLAQMQAKDRLLLEKDKELNELKELTLEQQEEKKTGEEALGVILEYRGHVVKAISLMNTVKLVKDVKLRAEYYGAITWARELLKSIEERAGAYFGPNIEINPEDEKEEE